MNDNNARVSNSKTKFLGLILLIALFFIGIGYTIHLGITAVFGPEPVESASPTLSLTPTPESTSTPVTFTGTPTPIVPVVLESDENMNVVNQYRTAFRIPKLIQEQNVCRLAAERLNEIHANFSHKGFNDRAEMLAQQGNWHENLGRYWATIDSVMDAWDKSPDHRPILRVSATYGCVATDNNYWVFIAWQPKK